MRTRPIVRIAALAALAWMASACGLPTGTSTPNEPAPSGTVLSAGQLYGLNGRTISGSASVYQTSPSNTYLIRIEGLLIDTHISLQLVATSSSSTYQTTLRYNRGTQNYDTGISADGRTWSSVMIQSTSGGVTPEYGKADLVSVH